MRTLAITMVACAGIVTGWVTCGVFAHADTSSTFSGYSRTLATIDGSATMRCTTIAIRLEDTLEIAE